eukprot:TRINITY_DN2925_c0_g1_i3.p4 TRINITY_DN2925_c0_g1~~TRINITY_DN2925_c0_g1_i3.p4  ORF type:complete len:119 (+),score=47.24 TRINITY_DN2925_c0_g1_i3:684-1040(+)
MALRDQMQLNAEQDAHAQAIASKRDWAEKRLGEEARENSRLRKQLDAAVGAKCAAERELGRVKEQHVKQLRDVEILHRMEKDGWVAKRLEMEKALRTALGEQVDHGDQSYVSLGCVVP